MTPEEIKARARYRRLLIEYMQSVQRMPQTSDRKRHIRDVRKQIRKLDEASA